MAISMYAAKQMMERGHMSHAQFVKNLRRGKIKNDFEAQAISGARGFAGIKMENGLYVVIRLYPTHYKMANERHEFTNMPDAIDAFDKFKANVTKKVYEGVEGTEQKVAPFNRALSKDKARVVKHFTK